MYYVMSAECVDGGIEPFLHAICENERDAVAEVLRVMKSLDMHIPPETNDLEKWADVRFDSDGLLAWDRRDPDNMKTVIAKWRDDTRKDLCL